MRIFRDLFKHKYIKVIKFDNKKTMTIKYYKKNNFNPTYLINPNHIFNHNGYTTLVITDSSTETINPLDFKSKYPLEKFKQAIETKIIKDTFNSLKQPIIDPKYVIIGIGIIAVVVYYLLTGGLIK